MSKKGQWQESKTEFVMQEGNNIVLSIAVEKRPMDKDVKALIYIDDIKVENID